MRMHHPNPNVSGPEPSLPLPAANILLILAVVLLGLAVLAFSIIGRNNRAQQGISAGEPGKSPDEPGVSEVRKPTPDQLPVSDRKVSFEEKLLATVPDFLETGNLWVQFSKDGSRVVYVARQGERAFIAAGDQIGPELGSVSEVAITRDYAFVNDQSGPRVVFSPDASRFACALQMNFRGLVVIDNKKSSEFAHVGKPVFSPDGSKLAYAAHNGQGFVIINDRRAGPYFQDVGDPVFSPDGSVMVYPAKLPNKKTTLVGDPAGSEFDKVLDPVFSPDGQTLVYLAIESGQHFVVVNGKEGPGFDEILAPQFTPVGKLAYWARKGRKWTLVIGDKRMPVVKEFDPRLLFSPDGRKWAYKRYREWPNREVAVINGKTGPVLSNNGELAFSPDGRKIAYTAGKLCEEYVVVGNKRGPKFNFVGTPVFNPRGTTVAYVARCLEKEFIVVGGKSGPAFDQVFPPVFSPDGNKVAYGARDGRTLWWKVMDIQR